MDKFAAMQLFVRVIETGQLSAAGRTLGLAPSSVSRRMNELEEMLGVRLLQRTTRKLSLTEAGEIYFERCRDIVEAVEDANLLITEARVGPSGTLRITVPASVARLHISPAVAAFQKLHPGLKVVINVTDRIVDVIGEGLDVGLRVGPLDDSSLMSRKVGEARRLVCAAPAYLERAGWPASPNELSDHACLTFRTHPGSNVWKFRSGKSLAKVRVTGSFFADDGETLIAAACAGLGLVVAPEWLVGVEIANGSLVEVLLDHSPDPGTTSLYAIFPPGPYIPPKVRAFVEFLAHRFARDYAWQQQH